MEKAELGKRGGNRKGIFRSHEAWEKAGRPNHYVFDHLSGEGHVKSPVERRLDEIKNKRYEIRNRRSTWLKRRRLQEKLEKRG